MDFTPWYIIVGLLLITMALSGSVVERLPLTTSILYLVVGVLLGPNAFGLLRLDPVDSAHLLERLSEIAVIVSLFTAGLKLSTPLSNPRWWLPVRLAFASMTVTVGLITLVGYYLLDLPLGAAVLLGAIVAPTDPVLASDVQVEHPGDRDRLRFSLTGEAGLNDGTAFPFVMLGLGLLGLHDLGARGWKWWAIDVLWAIAGGLAIGAVLGTLVGRLVVHLRQRRKEAMGLDDFLSLGLLASSYGLALLAHTYGFLAVFAAGLALRRVETQASSRTSREDGARDSSEGSSGGSSPAATAPSPVALQMAARAGATDEIDPQHVPALMAQAVLVFNEQLERLGEVALVILLGAMLTAQYLPAEAIWFVPLVLIVIRPVAVLLGLLGSRATQAQRGFVCWFGIRGVGSIYYLAYATSHGLPKEPARTLAGLTLTLILTSVVVHGLSVTPLMNAYRRFWAPRKRQRPEPDAGAPSERSLPVPSADD